MKWLMEVHNFKPTDEAGFVAMANSGKFERVDYRLSATLLELNKPYALTEEINRRIQLLQEGADILTGRQILWLFGKWLATKEELGGMYSIADLGRIVLADKPSCKQLENFFRLWGKTVAGQRVQLDEGL